MNRGASAPIPPPSPVVFHGAIVHPDLWLWDSWTATRGAVTDLYCLALARSALDQTPIAPARRNEYAFHVRCFRTRNSGLTWADEGCVIAPAATGDGAFARNVWSGSALDLDDGRRLHALTGVREAGSGRGFLQTLFLAPARSAEAAPEPAAAALLCPHRDYDRIRNAGYFLSEREKLGADEGEDGGPILAWRDPFMMPSADGIELVWSAKIGPKIPAIGRAHVIERRGEWSVAELHPPTSLPDAALMTQAEMPKIYSDAQGQDYMLLVSACDRLNETQPDNEVSKRLRLYKSSILEGPWRSWSGEGSLLPGLEGVFGASAISADFDAATLTLVAPITEQAAPALQLTIGSVRKVALRGERAQPPVRCAEI